MNVSIPRIMFAIALALFAAPLTASEQPKVGTKAKDFELLNLAGGETKLSKLTADGPVVLVVLRGYPGYQCPFCNTQVAEFLGKADEFKKAGAKVVFVYPGSADGLKQHAEEFTKTKTIPAHVAFLLDPDYMFANAYGLRWEERSETAYPSTFVIDGELKVKFARISHTHGDRASAADVLKALGKK